MINGFSFCRRRFTERKQPRKGIISSCRSIISHCRRAIVSWTRGRFSCTKRSLIVQEEDFLSYEEEEEEKK